MYFKCVWSIIVLFQTSRCHGDPEGYLVAIQHCLTDTTLIEFGDSCVNSADVKKMNKLPKG